MGVFGVFTDCDSANDRSNGLLDCSLDSQPSFFEKENLLISSLLARIFWICANLTLISLARDRMAEGDFMTDYLGALEARGSAEWPDYPNKESFIGSFELLGSLASSFGVL